MPEGGWKLHCKRVAENKNLMFPGIWQASLFPSHVRPFSVTPQLPLFQTVRHIFGVPLLYLAIAMYSNSNERRAFLRRKQSLFRKGYEFQKKFQARVYIVIERHGIYDVYRHSERPSNWPPSHEATVRRSKSPHSIILTPCRRFAEPEQCFLPTSRPSETLTQRV